MTQYIDKSAIVAEIRKRLLPTIRDKHYDEWEEGQNSERIAILDIIDTLEVKEEVTTDAFIEKAVRWLKKELPITDLSPSNMLDITFKVFDKECKKEFIEEFKKYMEK